MSWGQTDDHNLFSYHLSMWPRQPYEVMISCSFVMLRYGKPGWWMFSKQCHTIQSSERPSTSRRAPIAPMHMYGNKIQSHFKYINLRCLQQYDLNFRRLMNSCRASRPPTSQCRYVIPPCRRAANTTIPAAARCTTCNCEQLHRRDSVKLH